VPAAQPGTPLAVTTAVLVAAVLHAVWNALVKDMDDRLVGFALLDLTGVVISIPAVLLLPGPAPASWGFLAASVVLHVGYKLALMASYRLGDLSQVYPLARGTAPLLVAGFATVAIGERLGPVRLAGLLGVCAGLLVLVGAGGRIMNQRAMLASALATGVIIAAYTIADGLGVRRSGSPLGYIAWLFLLDGLWFPLAAAARRGRRLPGQLRASLVGGLASGVLSLLAYGLVIWAQSRGALAVVAALRESSVIFAALIGSVVFGERFGYRRTLAAVLVTVGIVLLNAAG
jgi:drug/metabolite transporter (DMT)-like permease